MLEFHNIICRHFVLAYLPQFRLRVKLTSTSNSQTWNIALEIAYFMKMSYFPLIKVSRFRTWYQTDKIDFSNCSIKGQKVLLTESILKPRSSEENRRCIELTIKLENPILKICRRTLTTHKYFYTFELSESVWNLYETETIFWTVLSNQQIV